MKGRTIALAALAYAALAIAITFPLVLHLSTGVPHDLGDPLLSTTILWWNAHVTPLTAEWWNGPWFHPETGVLAFSDHRLGASLIASPLQWAGSSPVAAYNVTLIAGFALCATGAFALMLALTGRADAAAVCGLAFGFNPYRMAHIEHLELLLAFGMPIALLALHRYRETRRPAWLAVLSAALVLQGLCSSYYLLFFGVFMALWVAWFVRWHDWRALASIGLASIGSVVLLSPIYVGYVGVHRFYGFGRTGYEVDLNSADVTSVVTASPMIALWGWTSHLNGPEKQTFPGLTISLLALAGAAIALRGSPVAPDRRSRWARVLWMVAAAVLCVAIGSRWSGPLHVSLGPLRLDIDVFYKPASLALLAAVAGLALSARLRDAYRRQSPLAFYGLAAAAMLLCSLGHRPRFLGEVILYRPPYAWLMYLPGFSDAVRVPARFTMPAVLALAVAGGLGFLRVAPRRRPVGALLVVCLLGIAADTWPRRLPIVDVPAPWRAGPGRDIVAVMELPLGGAEYDAAAMYRATLHGLPTVNGMSGYTTSRYRSLMRALQERDGAALDAVGASGPVLVAADKGAEDRDHWAAFLTAHPGATPAGEDDRWRFFRLEGRVSDHPVCGDRIVRPVAVTDGAGPIDLAPLADDRATTFWIADERQTTSDVLTLDFGTVVPLCGVGLSLGTLADQYPARVRLDTSPDGIEWQTGADQPTAALALGAALSNPADARIELTMNPVDARFARLRLVRSAATDHWTLAGLYGRAR